MLYTLLLALLTESPEKNVYSPNIQRRSHGSELATVGNLSRRTFSHAAAYLLKEEQFFFGFEMSSQSLWQVNGAPRCEEICTILRTLSAEICTISAHALHVFTLVCSVGCFQAFSRFGLQPLHRSKLEMYTNFIVFHNISQISGESNGCLQNFADISSTCRNRSVEKNHGFLRN